ncbi:MAG: radical SAM protein [Planctomycetes bacterium]|nr:radical SAM protein [Planctomycetota bacterium]
MAKDLSVVRGTKEKQTELSPIHDFAAKLTQPSMLPRFKDYVRWQARYRKGLTEGKSIDELLEGAPDQAPLSINLDLTTACNYRCDHCVDMDILNKNIRYDDDKLFEGLKVMAERGLKSVIVIGGGEPTLYPRFNEAIELMKGLGLKVGIVTNGSRMDKILEVAHLFEPEDWVRLSLDSGSDEVFQAMHKPRKGVTLDQICAGIPPIKAKNPNFTIGFSFIIVWKNCEANDFEIHENVQEIVSAAERAKKHQFDYISFKPFLNRAEVNNAEVVELSKEDQELQKVMADIRARVDEAKKLATDSFRVIESTNLKVLENGTYRNYTEQPKTCHMTFFRQVLSPLGTYNCPVYRHVAHAKVGENDAYAPDAQRATLHSTMKLIQDFNATTECREVTCLYNHVNWFVEDMIEHPEKLEALQPSAERNDYFL